MDGLLGSDRYFDSVPGDQLGMMARYKLLPAAPVGLILCQHGCLALRVEAEYGDNAGDPSGAREQ